MTYSEKLKDPRWQRKRLEVLSRDGFTCQLCGDKETQLHVHHNSYNGNPWDVDLSELKTYCLHCHFVAEHFKEHPLLNPPLAAFKHIGTVIDWIYVISKRKNGETACMMFDYNKETKVFEFLIGISRDMLKTVYDAVLDK